MMKIECPCCGERIPELPEGVTEHKARLALQAVLLWYAESPIREIQMANAMCGMHFPIREIEAALQPDDQPPQLGTVIPGDGADVYRGPDEPNAIPVEGREAMKMRMKIMSPPANPDKQS
jgi:hypothetical protein